MAILYLSKEFKKFSVIFKGNITYSHPEIILFKHYLYFVKATRVILMLVTLVI